MIEFLLHINPVAKGRPRLSKYGHVFTPDKTRQFEKRVRALAEPHRPKDPLKGALRIMVAFYMKPPKTFTRDLPTCRPDADNLLKCILDSLNPVHKKDIVIYPGFWEDDSQITTIVTFKRYDFSLKEGYIKVKIEPDSSVFVQ